MSDERTGPGPRAYPEGDTTTIDVQRRHGATAQFGLVADGDKRAAGHPHRRQVDDCTEVHGQTGTPRMVEPARVEEEELRAQVERRQRGGQDRALSAGQDPGHVRGGDTGCHDALGEDVVGLSRVARRRRASEMAIATAGPPIGRIAPPRDGSCPGPVARLARTCVTAGVRDEASAEDGPLAARQPGVGGQCARRRSGEAALELDEILVPLRPSPGIGCHSQMLAHADGPRLPPPPHPTSGVAHQPGDRSVTGHRANRLSSAEKGQKSLLRSGRVLQDGIVLKESEVRALAIRQGAPVVTSFYLDVDGRRYPRPSDYAPRVDHLLRLARRGAGPYGKDVVKDVEADLAHIAAWLESRLDRTTTRGVAAFSAHAQGIFEAFDLPVPVRDQVVVGPGPDVAQLCAILSASQPALVVAVDRQHSRLLRLDGGDAKELEAPTDEIGRQVDTDVEIGSFEHHHEELARRHQRRVARFVVEELERRPAKHVVLSGSPETVDQVVAYLPERVTQLVSGRIPLPISSRLAELAQAADDVISQTVRRHQIALAAELHDRAAEGASAVIGLAATLDALGAERVVTLVVEDGFSARGGRCGDCGQLVADGEWCPRCGASALAVENVVDAAITDAFSHHVTLEVCEEGVLAGLGHIGAFERPGSERG